MANREPKVLGKGIGIGGIKCPCCQIVSLKFSRKLSSIRKRTNSKKEIRRAVEEFLEGLDAETEGENS